MGLLLIAIFCSRNVGATVGTWNHSAGGNWSTPGDWTGGQPLLAGDVANLTTQLAAGRGITNNTIVSLGVLNLGTLTGASPETLANNGGSLTFDNNGNGALITEGNLTPGDVIATPFTLADNLLISNTVARTLTISGVIGDGGARKSITVANATTGIVLLSGVNTFSGDTIIESGTLALSAAGSIANSANIIVGSGGAFDVSAVTSSLALDAPQILSADATGANAAGTIALGLKGLTLGAIGGLAFPAFGGGPNAPLTLTGSSSFVLNGGPVAVTTTTVLTTGGSPYLLIGHGGTATVAGSPGLLTVDGSGLASGTSGALSINGSGDLILSVLVAGYHAPVASNDVYSVNKNSTFTDSAPGVLGNDTDYTNVPLTAIKLSDPAHGTVTFNSDGSFVYQPNNNFSGGDSFTYEAYDGTSNSTGTTVALNVINHAPVTVNDSYSLNENTALNAVAPGVLGNDTDADGDSLTTVLVNGPAHGSLTLNANGSFAYTPATNYVGIDSFTYFASDGTSNSANATVTLIVLSTGGNVIGARPNVIIILADDLGYGDVGFDGSTKIRTPVLDGLAAQGTIFTKAYAGAPVCAPSRCCLLTGKDSAHTPIRANLEQPPLGPQQFQLPLPAGTFTMGQLFKQAGYSTACIGKWGLGGPDSTGAPWLMGFDYYFGYLSQQEAHWYYPTNLYRNNTLVSYPGNNWDSGNVYSEDAIMSEAFQWIATNRTTNFFLYLTPTIPHQSLSVPAWAITNFYGDVNWTETPNNQPGYPNGYSFCAQPRRTYATMISYMDNDIGKLMTCLHTNGLDTNTIVIFTSDNGPVPPTTGDDFFDSNGPFRGMKGDVYDGGIREPFFVWWPGHVAAGATNNRTIAFWDLLPTFGQLLNQTFPPDVDGVSFLPTLLAQSVPQPGPSTLYWEYIMGQNEKAVRLGDWKGVRYGDAGAGVPMSLYNLSNDVAETTDLSGSNPALASQISQIMAARHELNTNSFRNKDEFPVISPRNLALSFFGIGYQLSTNNAVGFVLKPTEQAITTSFQFQFQMQLVSAAGYATNGSFIFGNDTNLANCIRAEVSGDARRFSLVYGTQSNGMSFAAGDDPFRIMNLEVAYSPVTGVLKLIEGTNTPVLLTLTGGPTQISQYGYYVNHSRATFSDVLIDVDAQPVSTLSLSPIQNGIFSFVYQRPAPAVGQTWRYLSSASLPGNWTPTTPFLEQPRNIFGNLQTVDAQFLFQPQSNVFYRVQYSASP